MYYPIVCQPEIANNYDENGNADLDIDYTNHGNPKQHSKVPHRHDWTWKALPWTLLLIRVGVNHVELTYKKLIDYLNMGREVEFTYKGEQYSITVTPDGFSFCKSNSDQSENFQTLSNLLDQIRIDGQRLEEIWSDVQVDVVY